ncbi:MAG TPA: type III-A CRISPR-associated protein Cas10/Csm1 [Halobacteria archaeon]|jgi:CRISPR-associated protein Csm1|nr:type III-A CRISPR-associated protein Cas10/Csm1 [Halobacteria archaeon]
MDEKTVQLAALLHDIGKFWQRTDEQFDKDKNRPKKAHQELSKDFIDYLTLPPMIDKDLLSTLVLRHEDRSTLSPDLRVSDLPKGSSVRRLARIVSDADNISAAMDREHSEEGEARHPLIPIFPQIKISGKNEIKEDVWHPDYYYKPSKLSLDNIGNVLQNEKSNADQLNKLHSDLWNEFCEEVKRVSTNDTDVWINDIYFLLQKYTSFVLSAGYRTKPDIPLFDHLKTTAAIAVSLYRWRKENNWSSSSDKTNAYLLIEGDLSGIQRFIFDLASPEEARPGMSKRLRGRSFWLTLLMDAIATEIIHDLDIPETNILWNTGGHFLILAPNLDVYQDKIEKIKRNINKHLLSRYDERLFLALETMPCNKNDLTNFYDITSDLTEKIECSKRQKFIDCNLQFGVLGDNKGIDEYCIVCGMPLINEDELTDKRCLACKRHEELGQELAKAEYLIKGFGLKSKFNFEYIGINIGYRLVGKDESHKKLAEELNRLKNDKVFVYKLNNTDFLDADLIKTYPNTSFGFKFLGNTVPIDEDGKVLSFEYIAQMSEGAKKIGVLKADVDNLGKIFAQGLEKETRSISRIHTMSSMFEIFFLGFLNKICERYRLYFIDKTDDEMIKKINNGQYRIKRLDLKDEDGSKIFYELNKKDRDGFWTYLDKDDERAIEEEFGLKIQKYVYKPYITYSGGDDLLIVGPYDTIIELAEDIRDEFKRFTCYNSDINISAGITVVNPHYPISRAIELTNNNLDKAKGFYEEKNRISLFNEVIKWDLGYKSDEKDFKTLFSLSKMLEDKVEHKIISKGFIYSLLSMWRATFPDLDELSIENQIKARLVRKRYMPYLKYQLARNIKNKNDREEIEKNIKPCMPWIRIPVSWISFRER